MRLHLEDVAIGVRQYVVLEPDQAIMLLSMRNEKVTNYEMDAAPFGEL